MIKVIVIMTAALLTASVVSGSEPLDIQKVSEDQKTGIHGTLTTGGNSAFIEQSGLNSTAEQIQTSCSKSSVSLIQTTYPDRQSGNSSYQSQTFSSRNELNVDQSGFSNTVEQIQIDGVRNKGAIEQSIDQDGHGSTYECTALQSQYGGIDNYVHIKQMPSPEEEAIDNYAEQHQIYGRKNTADIRQGLHYSDANQLQWCGAENSALIIQSWGDYDIASQTQIDGYKNSAEIEQRFGGHKSAQISQISGRCNNSSIFQEGDYNEAVQLQTNCNNTTARLNQVGNNLTSCQIQLNGCNNESIVNQSGDGNTSRVTQLN
jgi:hypothetical protein